MRAADDDRSKSSSSRGLPARSHLYVCTAQPCVQLWICNRSLGSLQGQPSAAAPLQLATPALSRAAAPPRPGPACPLQPSACTHLPRSRSLRIELHSAAILEVWLRQSASWVLSIGDAAAPPAVCCSRRACAALAFLRRPIPARCLRHRWDPQGHSRALSRRGKACTGMSAPQGFAVGRVVCATIARRHCKGATAGCTNAVGNHIGEAGNLPAWKVRKRGCEALYPSLVANWAL